jgi:hypothetical protein
MWLMFRNAKELEEYLSCDDLPTVFVDWVSNSIEVRYEAS